MTVKEEQVAYLLKNSVWDSPSLLPSGYWGFFPWRWSGQGGKLNTHLHHVPRLIMHGTVYSLPQYVCVCVRACTHACRCMWAGGTHL